MTSVLAQEPPSQGQTPIVVAQEPNSPPVTLPVAVKPGEDLASLEVLKAKLSEASETRRIEAIRNLLNSGDLAARTRGVSLIAELKQESPKITLINEFLASIKSPASEPDVTCLHALRGVLPSLQSDSEKLSLFQKIIAAHPDQPLLIPQLSGLTIPSLKNPTLRDETIEGFLKNNSPLADYYRVTGASLLPHMTDKTKRDNWIKTLCQDAHPRVRTHAAWAVQILESDLDKAAILSPAFLEAHPLEHSAALSAILSIKDSKVQDMVIVNLLKSQDPKIRFLGARPIQTIKNDGLRDKIIALLFNDLTPAEPGEESIKLVAVKALDRVSDPALQQQLFVRAFEDVDPKVRLIALWQIPESKKLDPAFSLKWIQTLLADSRTDVVRAAANQLHCVQNDHEKASMILTVAQRAQKYHEAMEAKTKRLLALEEEQKKLDRSVPEQKAQYDALEAQIRAEDESDDQPDMIYTLRAAVKAIATLEKDEYKIPLIQAFKHLLDPSVRASVADAIATVKDESKRPDLIKEQSNHEVYTVRDAHARAIHSIQNTVRRNQLIQDLSNSPHEHDRTLAADVTRLVSSDQEKAALIRKLATDKSPTVRLELGLKSFDSLQPGPDRDMLYLDFTQSKDGFFLLRVAELLGTIQDKEVKFKIVQDFFYGEPGKADSVIPVRALNAAMTFDDQVIQTKFIWDACKANQPSSLRAAGASHVHKIQNIGLRNEILTRLVHDPEPEVRLAAAANLDGASPTIRDQLVDILLKEKDPKLQAALTLSIFHALQNAEKAGQ